MFAGTIGVMQGLDSVLDSAECLLKGQPRIKFVFVGGGVAHDQLMQTAAERNLTNVIFLERQPIEAMAAILALADVLLVHLKDTPLFRMTIPSKLQAYIAVGKPILMGVKGDAAKIIQASDAGEVVEPENPVSIAQGVLKLFGLSDTARKRLGMNAREFYQKCMSMPSGIQSLEDIFRRVLNRLQP